MSLNIFFYRKLAKMRDYVSIVNRGIQYSFYAILFLTPLVLHPKTLELFEFNKLMLVYGVSLVILFFWISKMMLMGRIIFKRTPFDIPIFLFLLSQIISTIFSIDPYVSFWGYYTRFNGGLLSLATYIFLYYAFVSNFLHKPQKEENVFITPSYKMIFVSILSGIAVALWGFPSHFGRDLTCLFFRGSFDVSCWTDAFQPTVRLFSTLGQPNWLAAFLAILIPPTIALGTHNLSTYIQLEGKKEVIPFIKKSFYLLVSVLFFIEVLWASSQSGLLGLVVGLVAFFAGLFFFTFKKGLLKSLEFKIIFAVLVLFTVLSFVIGNPLSARFSIFSVQGFLNPAPVTTSATEQVQTSQPPALEAGGSDSGKIRLVVWRGALELFKRNPIFGTGVETFAYAYYQVKPQEHNLLSEWDYLYNKAHNEYLNYLATTGIVGLTTYLLFIGWFLWYAGRYLYKKRHLTTETLLLLSLVSSFITILVSNFFGFSVVIINFYLFFIPGLFYALTYPSVRVREEKPVTSIPVKKGAGIVLIGAICIYFELFLLNIWFADQEYSMGYNLDRVQEYAQANQYLENAVKLSPQEDLYKNELALNLAALSLLLNEQNQATQGALFKERSLQLANEVIQKHPNNVVFYKTRIQTLFILSQVDEKYYQEALDAISEARKLAPTDAKIAYNEGLLYGQKGDAEQAMKVLREAITLKENYRDPRYALAVYLADKAKAETDTAEKKQLLEEARALLQYNLGLNKDDKQSRELLESL